MKLFKILIFISFLLPFNTFACSVNALDDNLNVSFDVDYLNKTQTYFSAIEIICPIPTVFNISFSQVESNGLTYLQGSGKNAIPVIIKNAQTQKPIGGVGHGYATSADANGTILNLQFETYFNEIPPVDMYNLSLHVVLTY